MVDHTSNDGDRREVMNVVHFRAAITLAVSSRRIWLLSGDNSGGKVSGISIADG